MFKSLKCIYIFLFIVALFPWSSMADVNIEDNNALMGLPLGMSGSESPDLGICPRGGDTITWFLKAWSDQDWKTMYDLIDDDSKADYSFEQAKFDFQFMEYKKYDIQSVRKSGEDYEFIISKGDWKDGDKELLKVMIDGTSYKIVLQSDNSPFKRSAASYF